MAFDLRFEMHFVSIDGIESCEIASYTQSTVLPLSGTILDYSTLSNK